jgi:hypothetical protein
MTGTLSKMEPENRPTLTDKSQLGIFSTTALIKGNLGMPVLWHLSDAKLNLL